MLNLKRRRGERIVIDGGRVVITLIDCTHTYARIGVESPADVSVHREEVQARINAGGEASQAPPRTPLRSNDWFHPTTSPTERKAE